MSEHIFEKDLRPVGENFVWLTAMGLAAGLLMVIGLLAVILVNGVSVFWPHTIWRVELSDSAIGPAGHRTFAANLVEEREKLVKNDDGEFESEIKFFVGNKDIYGEMFLFVDSDAVVSREPAEDVIMAERARNGNAIFTPDSLILADGTEIAGSDPSFDTQFQKQIDANAQRLIEYNALANGPIGRLSLDLKDIDIRKRVIAKRHPNLAAEMLEMEQIVDRMRMKQATDAERIRYEEIAASSAVLREIQDLDTRKLAIQEEVDTYLEQTQSLLAANNASKLRYTLLTGETKELPTGEFLRFFRPNEMSLMTKVFSFIRNIWAFVTEKPRSANTEGGVFPAIFGTFVMTILMSAAVMPFGVLAAIYLREYAKQGPFTQAIRIAINNLAGVPSIVYGVFGLGFFVYGVGSWIDGGASHPMNAQKWFLYGFVLIGLILATAFLAMEDLWKRAPFEFKYRNHVASVLGAGAVVLLVILIYYNPFFGGFFSDRLLVNEPTFGTGGVMWAALTLAIMTVPVVVVATEEALAAVPRGMREASLACGASKWQTIQRVVLPASASGILTGLILAMARGAGEVAPLMVVGVVKLAPDLPLDWNAPFFHLDRKFMHLGFHIYDLGFQSPDSEAAKPMVFATTFLLIVLVVFLNLGAIIIRDHLRKKYTSGTF